MVNKILNKIFRRDNENNDKDPLINLINNGNILIGKDTDVKKLKIYYYELSEAKLNLNIGSNCLLENNITLYDKNSFLSIGDRVYIGPSTNLNCRKEIIIGNDVMFSWGCTVMDTNAHSLNSNDRIDDVIQWKKGWQYKDWSNVDTKTIKVGDKCWIGFNSIILKGVELGEGCVVAAGSVVTKSFEPFSIIGGNPARFIKRTQ